jgi:hypothetical protein
MKVCRLSRGLVPALLVCLLAQNAHGQTQTNAPLAPIGAIRQPSQPSADRQLPIAPGRIAGAEGGGVNSYAQGRPDNHTLSSIEAIGLGSLGVLRSFLDPAFRFSQTVDTGIVPGKTNSLSQIGVNLLFDRPGERSRFMGSYGGAHVFYSPSSTYNSTYHNLAVSEQYQWARWVLRLRDDFIDSTEAAFGGLSNAGTNSQMAYQASASASDTIYTQPSKRLNNAASGEINYLLSRRAALTIAGAYKTLSYSDPSYIDSHGLTGRLGYDYSLDSKNSIGLLYEYGRTNFSGAIPTLQTDMVQISYGRKVTGRLAMQVSAGPQVSRLGSILNRRDWSLGSALTYQTHRAQYSMGYAHGVTAGSGVFSGAESHTILARMQYFVSRQWTATVGGGYALNRALLVGPGVNDFFGNRTGNASLERTIGTHMRLRFDYALQQQGTGSGTCPSGGCGPTSLRQVGGMTLEWHPWAMAR